MQYSYVTKILKKFEDAKYDDEDKETRAELIDLMQKVRPLVVMCLSVVDAGIRTTPKGDYVGDGPRT
jgi:hypothetical protein